MTARLVDIIPGLSYTERGFAYSPPATIAVAVQQHVDNFLSLTPKVNSRHTRVYELQENDPLLIEYNEISDRWHTLQGKLKEMYHHV